jgi:twitching motility two-component system response regulator PilH
MKLKEISPELLQCAIEAYLRIAYPGDAIPPRVQALLGNQSPWFSVSWMEDERMEFESSFGSNRFFLRLGNHRYPNMKLGIVEMSGLPGEYVFLVDTHDRHFELPEDSPGYATFREVQTLNGDLKEAVEQSWMKLGLPTERNQGQSSHPCGVVEPGTQSSYTILAVDDTDYMLLLLQKVLRHAGFRVLACPNAGEALKVAREQTIHLGIFDVMMPGIDGYQLIENLKGEGFLKFPVLLATAAPENQVKKQLADAYIAKPFTPPYLVKTVRRLLGTFYEQQA